MIVWIRLLYNLAFPLVLLLLLPGFLHRMLRRGKYRHKFWQRFGIYSPRVRERIGRGRTWVHAVSVGEVMIALKLIAALRQRDPGLRVVLSTTTTTGFKLAARSKAPWLEPIYNPLDFLLTARAAVRTIRPSRLVLVEAEAWPNLVAEAKACGARVTMVNTRLSPRSERRFRAARWLAAPVFNQVDVFCLQEEADVARWVGLGVEASKLRVTGSVKFDDESAVARESKDFRPVLRSLGLNDGSPILLGGSTFPGEEELLAQVYLKLKSAFPELFLIVVPRHVERSKEIIPAMEALGLRVVRRTALGGAETADVLLVDTTGELRDWYGCSSVVFVGKSLLARGGQNPAEPVVAGAPVIFGPHMGNFATLSRQFLRLGAALEVTDGDSLRFAVDSLLRDAGKRQAMVAAGRNVLLAHRGATIRTCEILEKS
ncbi:MAG: 3-deoxy-D-manno-octulosonic acid transferase [Terrimicrobiaceae bacterium]|nr:3-deoxy-D-manno-octulosonic acid transferase [Terrimicrobiaceae bacterium]